MEWSYANLASFKISTWFYLGYTWKMPKEKQSVAYFWAERKTRFAFFKTAAKRYIHSYGRHHVENITHLLKENNKTFDFNFYSISTSYSLKLIGLCRLTFNDFRIAMRIFFPFHIYLKYACNWLNWIESQKQ